MLGSGHRLDGDIDDVGHSVHRQSALAARHPGVGALRDDAAAGGGWMRCASARPFSCSAAAEQQHHAGAAAAQRIGGFLDLVRRTGGGGSPGSASATTPPSFQEVSDGRISVAIWPGAIIAACTAAAASRAHGPHVHRGAHPAGDAARPALGIGGQRRIQRPVIGRLVADDVDDRGRGAAGVVQIGQAVGEAGTAVQQRRGGLAGHPRVAVGGAGHHAFEQAEHAVHAGNAVERGDEMHLRRAGVGETGVDAAFQQRMHQAFGAVHSVVPWYPSTLRTGPDERKPVTRLPYLDPKPTDVQPLSDLLAAQRFGHSPGVATSSEWPSGSRKYRLVPTPGPDNAAFHRDIPILKRYDVLPRGQLSERDRERQVQRPASMMRRNEPVRPGCRLIGHAMAKQQQHLLARHLHRAHAIVVEDRHEPEQPLIKTARPLQIVHVE